MAKKLPHSEFFALPSAPPETLEAVGVVYRLARVFKHDFWAATCQYEAIDTAAEFPKIVVKFGRSHFFAGMPLQWLGRAMVAHEEAIYHKLQGVSGIPRFVGRLSPTAIAIEYIDALPLDHFPKPPAGYFEATRKILDAIHARDVAYVDANKRSNLLVTEGTDAPVVIDFQISLAAGLVPKWLIRYFQSKDIYHLYKHKRRMSPEELTAEEEALSRKRSGLHRLHRKLTKPYRAFRRDFLQKKFAAGTLKSPTADMEDHHQPEKETWRKD